MTAQSVHYHMGWLTTAIMLGVGLWERRMLRKRRLSGDARQAAH